MTRWTYTGDVNLKHGGNYFALSTWRNGYVESVCVTDLESGCGYDGAWLIESRSILLPDLKAPLDVTWFKSSLDCCGYHTDGISIFDGSAVYPLSRVSGKMVMLDALSAYGRYDTNSTEIVAIGKEAKDSFDGFTLDTRLHGNAKLSNYVRNKYLKS